jgi:hypothetical protein
MYFSDLSPYPYSKRSSLSVGWLDSSHDYEQGEVPKDFLERLSVFCDNPVFVTMGVHECDFCQGAGGSGGGLEYGSGEIWVFGPGSAHYVAPDMIQHYVVRHHYRPPEEFIQAVLACPLPDTSEYKSLVIQAR